MLSLWWCPFKKKKWPCLQFTKTDYLSLVLTPVRIRWRIPLKSHLFSVVFSTLREGCGNFWKVFTYSTWWIHIKISILWRKPEDKIVADFFAWNRSRSELHLVSHFFKLQTLKTCKVTCVRNAVKRDNVSMWYQPPHLPQTSLHHTPLPPTTPHPWGTNNWWTSAKPKDCQISSSLGGKSFGLFLLFSSYYLSVLKVLCIQIVVQMSAYETVPSRAELTEFAAAWGWAGFESGIPLSHIFSL
jgi:hypothetical protein